MSVEMFGADAAQAILDRYAPREMQKRIERGTQRAGRAMVPIIRSEINSSIKGHGKNPGMLARKVSVRKMRASLTTIGGVGTVVIGSTAPHNHLVIRGHRITGHGGRGRGRATGQRTRPNPFIDRVQTKAWAVAGPVMRREVYGD